MKDSLLAKLRPLPGRLVDALLRWQTGAAGLVAVHGHHVFAPALRPGAVVVDAGAHRGAFSRAMIERFDCRCFALEPVPRLFAQIAEGGALRRFLLALGGREGSVTLHLSANPEANSLDPALAGQHEGRGSLTARVSTLRGFLSTAGLAGADLLKMDIEGAEVAVFETASDEDLLALGQITVEFHDFVPGGTDPAAIDAIRGRLRRLGFRSVVLSWPASNHSDTLFLNGRRHPLTAAQRFHLAALDRLTLPLRRRLHRAGSRLADRRRAAEARAT